MIKLDIFLTALLISLLSSSANAAVNSWEASSGLTPDQVGFELGNTSVPEIPTLDNSILTISNDSRPEVMYYIMREPAVSLQFPETFEVSFRMRYVSGSSGASGRKNACVAITLAPNIGCGLYIGHDVI